MSVCEYCNKKSKLLFICSQCGKRFCNTHRHPESHDCTGNEHNNDPFSDYEQQRQIDQETDIESQEFPDNMIEDEISEEASSLSDDQIIGIGDSTNIPIDDVINSWQENNQLEKESLLLYADKNEDINESDKATLPLTTSQEVSGLKLALTHLSNAKIPLLVIIILSILAGALMGTLTDLNNPQINLQQRYDALYQYYSDLQTQNQDLNQQLDDQTIQISTLANELNTTKAELIGLQTEIANLFSDSTHYIYPTSNQLTKWLDEDQTDQQTLSQEYTAVQQAIQLSLLGKGKNWKIGVVKIYGDFNGETQKIYNIVALEPDIFLYINPQTDNLWWTAYYEKITPNQTWNVEIYTNITITDVDTILPP